MIAVYSTAPRRKAVRSTRVRSSILHFSLLSLSLAAAKMEEIFHQYYIASITSTVAQAKKR